MGEQPPFCRHMVQRQFHDGISLKNPDDPAKGIFLEITDIPDDWLRNHYEVLLIQRTPYNGGAYPVILYVETT